MVFVDNRPNTIWFFDETETSIMPDGSYQTVFIAAFILKLHVELGEFVHLTFSCEVRATSDIVMDYRFFRSPDVALGSANITISHAQNNYETIYIEAVIYNLIPGDHWIDLHAKMWSGVQNFINYEHKTLMAQIIN
jgi:hypothetical protein